MLFAQGFYQETIVRACSLLRDEQHPSFAFSEALIFHQNPRFGRKTLEPNLITSKLVETSLSKEINGESSTVKTWLTYSSHHYLHDRHLIDELDSCKMSIKLLNSASKKIQQVLTND
ncbi:Serine/threonine-protein kinase SMG1 [Gigaspora margarita]|uniref:Serine/threonine-protein kinase SMG1 n=1 Tax=Gigaspora margarita TaxID=4874 RepID=A0A8H4ABI8_GIGMA|nr:Serine/threonine-protein kinase SMG1 [Gigaspora margarita]